MKETKEVVSNIKTYCNVDIVSSTAAGVTAQIILVLALPPKEFCKILVSLLSL